MKYHLPPPPRNVEFLGIHWNSIFQFLKKNVPNDVMESGQRNLTFQFHQNLRTKRPLTYSCLRLVRLEWKQCWCQWQWRCGVGSGGGDGRNGGIDDGGGMAATAMVVTATTAMAMSNVVGWNEIKCGYLVREIQKKLMESE